MIVSNFDAAFRVVASGLAVGIMPMLAGERFFLVPPWCDDPAPPGRLRLEIYPGMACGTGRHPATQLCLEALERTVRPGMTLVDVGTGSGILSAGARENHQCAAARHVREDRGCMRYCDHYQIAFTPNWICRISAEVASIAPAPSIGAPVWVNSARLFTGAW